MTDTTENVTIVDTLAGLSEEDLALLEAHEHPFFGRYLRTIESIGLDTMIDDANLHYVLARRGGRVVALCPVLELGPHAVGAYSLRKTFFSGWDTELGRLEPRTLRWIPLLRQLTVGYANLVARCGVPLERTLLAVCPLTYRGGIGVIDRDSPRSVATERGVLATLLELGRQRGLIVGVLGVPAIEEGQRLYRDAGMTEVFQFRDHYLDLPGDTFEDWLGAQSSKSRNKRRRELKQFAKTGVTIARETEVDAIAETLATLYEATYARYSQDHFRHPPEFWRQLARLPTAEILVARQEDRIVGVKAIVYGTDAINLRVGEPTPKTPHVFFNLVFYEPIRRAYANGRRRLWLGPGNSEVKLERGAKTLGLYSYFAFPNRRSRAALASYFSAYSRIAERVTAEPVVPGSA